jgi:hypothetical protein
MDTCKQSESLELGLQTIWKLINVICMKTIMITKISTCTWKLGKTIIKPSLKLTPTTNIRQFKTRSWSLQNNSQENNYSYHGKYWKHETKRKKVTNNICGININIAIIHITTITVTTNIVDEFNPSLSTFHR